MFLYTCAWYIYIYGIRITIIISYLSIYPSSTLELFLILLNLLLLVLTELSRLLHQQGKAVTQPYETNNSSKVDLVFKNTRINRRQDAPSCFDLTTIAYVSRPEYIVKASSMWDGNVYGVEIPAQRCIDIDTPLDFSIAKFLMEDWKNSKHYL